MGWGFGSDFSSSSSQGPPCEVLRVNKRYGGAQLTIDRVDASSGHIIPVYAYHKNMDEKALAIVYADPHAQPPGAEALAMAKLHTMAYTIDIVVRGYAFAMTSNNMGTGHGFNYMGHDLEWSISETTYSSSTLYLRDGAGQTLARYKRRLEGFMSSMGMGGGSSSGEDSSPVFELFVPPQSIDMDMFVMTGMAAAEFRAKEKKDGIKAAGEVFGAM